MIYLDNAATTGIKPPPVLRAVSDAMRYYSANPGRSGHKKSEITAERVFAAREKTADFFGASGAERVVFTLNCTHSLNIVIKGIINRGDRVVTSLLEHNSVMRPLVKCGAVIDTVPVSLYDDDETFEEFSRRITADTRLVICTGASNVLGRMLPVARIGALCRERGVPFAVDAAQNAGVTKINLSEMNIDYLCVAPHKGLYAPMGTGILIAEKQINNTITEGGTGTQSGSLLQPSELPEQLESGTVNVPGIMGIAAGIDYVTKIGTENIYRHEMQLINMLYKGLSQNPGVILYTPPPVSGYAPVLSFNLKRLDSSSAARLLDERGIAVRAGLHCAPGAHGVIGTLETGTVRVCPGVFNTANEIRQLLHAVKDINK